VARQPLGARHVKTLYLLRHAKSDWSDPSLTDHDRPLNKRGKRARHAVADHVAGMHVDLVVCSTARRARATAKPVVEALGCRVDYDGSVYGAGADGLLDVVHALDDALDSVMLVGHNPSMEELTDLLCGASPAYPTAALGTVELAVDRWVDVVADTGTLAGFFTARDPSGGEHVG
jgi:phosphohistidine phosphatase